MGTAQATAAVIRREAPAKPRLAWGIIEAALACACSASFIRKQISEGKLRSVRLGRRVVITDDDLRNWVNNATPER